MIYYDKFRNIVANPQSCGQYYDINGNSVIAPSTAGPGAAHFLFTRGSKKMQQKAKGNYDKRNFAEPGEKCPFCGTEMNEGATTCVGCSATREVGPKGISMFLSVICALSVFVNVLIGFYGLILLLVALVAEPPIHIGNLLGGIGVSIWGIGLTVIGLILMLRVIPAKAGLKVRYVPAS